MIKSIAKISVLVAVVLSLTLTTGLGQAQAYKKGDTIRFLVPYSAGGGYDTYARLIRPFWEKEIEKEAGVDVTFIVQNMPGAGGELCYTELHKSKPDGKTLTIVHTAGAVSRQSFLGVPYDIKKWGYIGQIAFTAPGFSIRSDLKLWSFWDAVKRSKEKPIIIGTAGYGDGTHLHPLFTKLFLERKGKEVNFKYVHFKGYTEARASMARREVEGAIGTPESFIPDYVEGRAHCIALYSDKRHSLFPCAPTIFELGLPEAKELFAATGVPRAIVTAPGTPDKIANVLRDTFKRAFNNAEFKEKAKGAKRPISYLSADETRELCIKKLEVYKKYEDIIGPIVKGK
jgi:tripartite-type tricarboxylate transporter receptor subunit TctC